jgi:hypothetical protein
MWTSGVYAVLGTAVVTYHMILLILFLLLAPQSVPRKQFSAISGGDYFPVIMIIANIQWDVCY